MGAYLSGLQYETDLEADGSLKVTVKAPAWRGNMILYSREAND
jgi:hypothetical protein